LPEEWTTDPVRRKQNNIPEDIVFRTKPQIALELLDRAWRNGIQVLAWTADALNGRDSAFLDEFDERCQAYVIEIPGRDGWSLRKILRVALGRWPIEDCFREAKEGRGLDHFECRVWRCMHRHMYVTILSQLFCARVRQRLSPSEDVTSGELLTVEQVRRAVNIFLEARALLPPYRRQHRQH
jgi:SRSO17 transposase